MRWDEGHESPDVIDRRGEGGRGGPGLGGLLGLLPLVTRMRGGWIVVLLVVGLALLGGLGGLGGIFGGDTGDRSTTAAPVAGRRSDDKKAQFVAFVLDDTQASWRKQFEARGKSYRNAKLVMFTGATQTACGNGQAAAGPFYCPSDERVYIDLSFYTELEQRLGAKGDFAQAYVIAHEIGHHVQHQLGISDRVHNAKGSQRGAEGNSVRLELQADCFAGIWAKSSNDRNILEPGDIDEALGAAAAIGDDRLQKQSGGRVNPETWTHGSSAERSRWFKTGYLKGSLEACNTFDGAAL
ncbi:MAG TPA: neutral zinc metallopeptidase [Labilithrix sp.]|nr:neutral zinc metallopeptidase [Labilithrix sp.]